MGRGIRRRNVLDAHEASLRDLRPFDACSPHELRTVARNCTPVVRAAGRGLAREGAPALEFLVIASGSALVTLGGVAHEVLRPGDWFGDVELLYRSRYSSGLVALTEVELIVMSTSEFSALFESVPSFRRRVVTRLAGRAHERRCRPAPTPTMDWSLHAKSRMHKAASSSDGRKIDTSLGAKAGSR